MSLLLLPKTAAKHRGASDPYFSNVTFLVHGTGSNGSTTITDVISGNTWTAHGSAQISTSKGKWAGSSIYCSGSGNYVTAAASSNFAFGTTNSVPFTIEGWIYRPSATGGNECLLDLRDGSSGGIAIYASLATTFGSIGVFNNSTLVVSGAGNIINTGAWHHWAVCFDTGPMLYFYIDGVLKASAAYDPAWQTSPAPFLSDNIIAPSQPLVAYHNDLRGTKGVNRYPGGTTFTPPTAQFPNF